MKLFSAAFLSAILLSLTFSCKTVEPPNRYPDMVADMDPFQVGAISAEFDRILSSRLNKVDVAVHYYPRLNSVALEFRGEFVTYWQFWDESARQQFAAALERYKENYAEQKLIDRYTRTRSVYGKVQGRLEWSSSTYSQTYTSFPEIEIGYRFKEKAPFFATLMRSALEEKNEISGAVLAESMQMNMYFTRAQADELVALFDQDHLMRLLSSLGVSRSREPLVLDLYREFEDNDNTYDIETTDE